MLTSISEGSAYLFMTVTHYFTGRVRAITPTDIVLDDAAWIANTGYLADCIAKGTVVECEPIGSGAVITRNVVVTALPWPHKLPLKVIR